MSNQKKLFEFGSNERNVAYLIIWSVQKRTKTGICLGIESKVRDKWGSTKHWFLLRYQRRDQ